MILEGAMNCFLFRFLLLWRTIGRSESPRCSFSEGLSLSKFPNSIFSTSRNTYIKTVLNWDQWKSMHSGSRLAKLALFTITTFSLPEPLMIENNLYYTLGKVVLLLEIIMGLSVLFVLNTRIDLPLRSRSTAIN